MWQGTPESKTIKNLSVRSVQIGYIDANLYPFPSPNFVAQLLISVFDASKVGPNLTFDDFFNFCRPTSCYKQKDLKTQLGSEMGLAKSSEKKNSKMAAADAVTMQPPPAEKDLVEDCELSGEEGEEVEYSPPPRER